MARAGFYAVESGKISFRRDGNWYSDEDRIDNARIALLFSRSIKRNPDGSYFLQVGDERASITVEDTPYVVKSIDGSPQRGFVIKLNDDETEPLDPSTLEIGSDNVLYCQARNKTFRARFLRPAYYELSRYFEPDRTGGFSISVGGKRYQIGGTRNSAAASERPAT